MPATVNNHLWEGVWGRDQSEDLPEKANDM
jgi:hypothetical protein